MRKGAGQVVSVEAAGVGKNPRVAAAEKSLLKTHLGVFYSGNNAIRMNADKGDHGRAPASHFGLKPPAAGAKFLVGEFIRAGGGALDDIGDAKLEVQEPVTLKRRKDARRESAAVKSSPKAIARAAEVVADSGSVEARVYAREEDYEVFGREVRDPLVARSKNLLLVGFPRSNQRIKRRVARV